LREATTSRYVVGSVKKTGKHHPALFDGID